HNPPPLAQIARELNVDLVLEGSVTRVGSEVRVRAQLINATDDQHLWAESYERTLTDIIGMQNEIASAVAEQVRAKLTPSERSRLATAQPVNPVAYEAYLKGRYHWNKRTVADLRLALDYFNRSVMADPNYAMAYVGLADSYN